MLENADALNFSLSTADMAELAKMDQDVWTADWCGSMRSTQRKC
jgi:hypothetical protein